MKKALKLSENNRVLSAGIVLPKGSYKGMPIVETLPDGNIVDYLYINGEYIYSPLPEPEQPEPQPTQLDIIEAQVTYTAMMTDTLLEV